MRTTLVFFRLVAAVCCAGVLFCLMGPTQAGAVGMPGGALEADQPTTVPSARADTTDPIVQWVPLTTSKSDGPVPTLADSNTAIGPNNVIIGPLAYLPIPVAVESVPDGDIFASYAGTALFTLSTRLGRRSADGALEVETEYEAFLVAARRNPNSGALYALFRDGRIGIVDPATTSIQLLVDLRAINVDESRMLEVGSRTVGTQAFTDLPQTYYGDFAVHTRNGQTEFLVTGMGAGTFPFVLRLRLQGSSVTEARGLMWGFQEREPVTGTMNTLTRGIAVDSKGMVLTTLPVRFSTTALPSDAPVTFPAGYAAENGDPVTVYSALLASRGAASFGAGRFVVAHRAAPVCGAEAGMARIDLTARTIDCVAVAGLEEFVRVTTTGAGRILATYSGDLLVAIDNALPPPPPVVRVAPASVQATVEAGGTGAVRVTVANDGDSDLTWSVRLDTNPAAEPATAPKQRAAPPPRVSAELLDAAADGPVRVIAHLRTAYAPESTLSKSAVHSQRTAIAAAQTRVLKALALPADRATRLSALPLLIATVDPSGLHTLAAHPDVAHVWRDVPQPGHLEESIQLVGAPEAWNLGYTGTGTAVAILDTGVDSTHPFLQGRVMHEACFSNPRGSTESTLCPGGSPVEVGPGSAQDCEGIEGCGHGTHVAGIAAGRGVDRSGVAPNTGIVALQVFTRFNDPQTCANANRSAPCVLTYTSDQVMALDHVYQLLGTHNIAAVNMSLGGGQFDAPCPNQPQAPAIDQLHAAGVATVISSGNDGHTNALGRPACIPSAIRVGATTDGTDGPADEVTAFSNSAWFLDLLAPGKDITSSIPGGQYAALNGTSMAAPHVAGAWALLRERFPEASVEALRAHLRTTGVPITDARNGMVTPRLQVDAALQQVPWLHVMTPAGTVAPGAASAVDLTVDAARLVPGTYTAEIAIHTNDPATPVASVPLVLAVTPSQATAVVNEWYAGPAADTPAGDANGDGRIDPEADAFVEIYNVQAVPMDVSGYRLVVDGTVRHRVPDGTRLESQQALTVFGGGRPAGVPGLVDVASTGSLALAGASDLAWTTPEGVRVDGASLALADAATSMTRDPDFTGPFVPHRSAFGSAALPFSPGRSLAGDPLPVELAAWAATAQGADVLLTWTTASEHNNAGFYVEHRPPDGAWAEGAFVPGAGTQAEPTHYRHRLRDLAPGEHAVRLRQVDHDGTATWTPVRTVEVRLTGALTLVTVPNPVRDRATVRLALRDAQPVRVAIYDLLGRRVATLFDGTLPAHQTHRFALEPARRGLASGIYFVRVEGASTQATEKLTVVR